MAKAERKQKLKVFSTPIGFHDALVAAPSQKAALEAWGAGTNLFSQGSAHVVTDPELAKIPLQHPGQVVKVLRGSKAEQLAALGKQKFPEPSKRAKAEVLPKRSKERPPRPSGAAVTKAETALEKLEKRQASQRERLEERRRTVEHELRDLRRRHEREREEAQEELEKARDDYDSALARYEGG